MDFFPKKVARFVDDLLPIVFSFYCLQPDCVESTAAAADGASYLFF